MSIDIYDGAGFINNDGDYVTIHLDYDCESPRRWGCLGTFYTWMRHYDSPDENTFDGFDDLGESFGIRCDDNPGQFITKFNDMAGVCLPVYALDHSGVYYRAGWSNPFHDPWDSGFVGVTFVTKERIRERFGVKRVTKKVRRMVVDALKDEVSVYNDWAGGVCYGFVIHDRDDNWVDSCWGFIGDDAEANGLAEACHGLNEAGMDLGDWLESNAA